MWERYSVLCICALVVLAGCVNRGDSTPPAQPVTVPADGASVNSSKISLTYDEPVLITRSTLDEWSIVLAPLKGNTLFEYTPLSLSAGQHSLRVTAEDMAGNSVTTLVTFGYRLEEDDGAPAEPVITPTGNITNKRPEVVVKYNETVNLKLFKLDDKDVAVQNKRANEFKYALDRDLAEGEHVVRVTAEDDAGNGVSATKSFYVYVAESVKDTTPPGAPTFDPYTGKTISNKLPTITITFAEAVTIADAKLDNVRIELSHTDNKVFKYTPAASLADGEHILSITAADLAQNSATFSSMFVIGANDSVDTTAPPKVTNIRAVDVGTGGKVNVTWDVCNATDFSYYALYKAESKLILVDGMPATKVTQNSTTSYVFSGLTNGKEYWFAVTCVDAAGNEDVTVVSSSATPAVASGQSPTAEAGSTISAAVNSTATLNGTGTDPDGSIVLYEWDFEGDGTYDWNATSTGVTTHVYNQTGIYTAKLRVKDNSGNLATDTTIVNITSATDLTAPTITNIAVAVTNESAYLSWNTSELANATVYYGLNSSYGSTITNTTFVASRNITIGSLVPNTAYHYMIMACDAAGNCGNSSDGAFTTSANADTTPPSVTITAPANSTYNSTSCSLSFAASEAVSSCIYELNGANTTFNCANSTAITAAEGSNALRVFANDSANNRGASAMLHFSVDTTAPAAVNALTNGSVTSNSIFLNWTGYNEAGNGTTGYYIYYANASFNSVASWINGTAISGGIFTHTVQPLTNGTNYWFAVTAVDAMANENKNVVPLSVTTLP